MNLGTLSDIYSFSKVSEKRRKRQFKIAAIQTDSVDEPQATVVLEEVEVEIPEIEETLPEDAELISEIIDYTKLSIEECASLLPVPTDDSRLSNCFAICES